MMFHCTIGYYRGTATSVAAAARAAAEQTWSGEERPKEAGANVAHWGTSGILYMDHPKVFVWSWISRVFDI